MNGPDGDAHDGAIHVLFITALDLAAISGSNVATRSVVRELGRRDDVRLTLMAPAPADGSDLAADLPIARWEVLPKRGGRLVTWHLSTTIRVWWRLRRLLRVLDPDIVAVRHALFFVPAALWFPRPGVHLVLLIRGSLRMPLGIGGRIGKQLGRLPRRISLSIVGRADRLLFAYPEAIGPAGDALPTDAIRVIPNGANLEAFPSLSKAEARTRPDAPGGLDGNDRVVGFAGSLRPRHCLEELFEASAILHRRGEAHRLLIVGDGPVRPALDRLAEALGIQDSIHFVGAVPHAQVGPCLAACDVLYGVVDPHQPSNPIKVYEGLAVGRPVVTSVKPELNFVRERGFGVLVRGTDPNHIAAALQEALAMEWTDEDAAGARSYIEKHHGWDRLATEIVGVKAPPHPTQRQ